MTTLAIINPSVELPPVNTTNEPLPDIQKREIQGFIFEAQEELESLRAELVKAQDILNGVRSRLEMKQSKIATLKTMVSPLKDFPNELISTIFAEYAQSQSFKPPWILGHICSGWREVALTTPHLWNRIDIPLQIPKPIFYSSFNKEKELFVRAEKSLIICRILLERPSSSLHYFLPMFTQYAGRLGYLRLKSIENFLPLLRLPGGSLSSLETLDLHCCPRGDFAVPSNITFFEDAHKLRRLHIETNGLFPWDNPNLTALRLPWAQLTHLLLSPFLHMRFDEVHPVLFQCTNLVHCSLPIPPDGSPGDFGTIGLRRLRILEFTNPDGLDYRQLFRHLLLPSLKRLTLTSVPGTDVIWSQHDLVDLIIRSTCDVHIFNGLLNAPEALILAILDKMPFLTSLSIRDIGVLPSILGRMAHEDFLPMLTSFECHTSFPEVISAASHLIDAMSDTGFMEPLMDDSDHKPLTITFIVNNLMGGYNLNPTDGLQRNWLNFEFRMAEEEDE
jgi:hypothetical protein